MTHALALRRSVVLRRRRGPNDPGPAVLYFSLIAAAGFVVGWVAQVVGGW